MRLAPFALVALLLAACDSGPLSTEAPLQPDGLRLEADRDRYDNDDTVGVTLTNVSARAYEMGVCVRLERWDGAAWRDVTPERACILLLAVVEPGGVWTTQTELGGVPDGSYRVAHEVVRQGGGSEVTVTTAAFRVE